MQKNLTATALILNSGYCLYGVTHCVSMGLQLVLRFLSLSKHMLGGELTRLNCP